MLGDFTTKTELLVEGPGEMVMQSGYERVGVENFDASCMLRNRSMGFGRRLTSRIIEENRVRGRRVVLER